MNREKVANRLVRRDRFCVIAPLFWLDVLGLRNLNHTLCAALSGKEREYVSMLTASFLRLS